MSFLEKVKETPIYGELFGYAAPRVSAFSCKCSKNGCNIANRYCATNDAVLVFERYLANLTLSLCQIADSCTQHGSAAADGLASQISDVALESMDSALDEQPNDGPDEDGWETVKPKRK